MKKNISILILILICQCTVMAQVKDTALNKQRSVRIRNGNRITMQSSIDKLKRIAIKSVSDHYYLKKGSFSGTDSIDIEINKNNQVTAVSFFYDTVSTYAYEVNLFNNHFDLVGKEFQFISKNGTMKATKWEDKYTVFEMVEIKIGNKWKLYSVLFDKELYFKKIKQCIDLSKNENSIEILKRLEII